MKKFMKAALTGLVGISLVACSPAASSAGTGLKDGTYTGKAAGRNGDVTVEVVVKDGKIASVTPGEHQETAGISDAAFTEIPKAMVEKNTPAVDTVSGATITSEALITAAKAALAEAGWVDDGSAAKSENVEVTFEKPGTYEGTADGYNGPVTVSATYEADGLKSVEIVSSKETAHVGDVAFPIIIEDAVAANGSGVDVVSGATFSSLAVKNAIAQTAEMAGASNLEGFKKNKVAHDAGEDKDLGTYDVIVVGAGGAGMGAAAQAVQNGLSVLVLEENAEIGGNTLVSGGQFQATMPYLVWDPANPDAEEGTFEYNGQSYAKVKASHGQLATLKEILNWSEEEFSYGADEPFEAGDIAQLAPHGVHGEYLDVLKALKAEIAEYVTYAEAKLAAGASETDLTLFSTDNLHIFQTYYGGLRRSADGSSWIYGNVDLVKQFCTEGYDLKCWLEDQGALFNDAAAVTLIGALWYRENINIGCDIDGDGTNEAGGNWGSYFLPTKTTIESNADSAIVTRTTVDALVTADGKVTGVEGHAYDGTKVTATAKEGVILATGGYAANVNMVIENNEYWDESYVTSAIKTTNRSSLQGDGIKMAEAVGADTTGMGFPQMMPISWIDNGNLAFGNGLYANYINPTTGKRFVDESAERDVLSLGEFANGADVNGVKGVFMEITNFNTDLTYPYPYNKYERPGVLSELGDYDVENRVYYFSSQEELKEIMDKFGFTADPATIYATIEQYDRDMHDGKTESEGVLKMQSKEPIGNWDGDNYTLEGVKLRVRLMAPSTHHTMGGVTVDTARHVLNADGEAIPGLYAAGEVTGGIHAGNRLGGNAIVEIFVSGRTAANTIAGK